MREENMADGGHLIEIEIAHAAARVNEYIVIDEQRRRAAVEPDSAATAQNLQAHSCPTRMALFCKLSSATKITLAQ
jgi:hypothetical protein